MDNELNTSDDKNYMFDMMILFLFHCQRQENIHKMFDELDKELRQRNRFFPDSKLLKIIQSLSSISCLQMRKGTKLFRCRLIGKGQESEFLTPLRDICVKHIKIFVPDFNENAGMTELMRIDSYFYIHPNERSKWKEACQQDIKLHPRAPFWGYDKQGSDAPPSGRSKAGRINPDGISYLYTAGDIKTAILEVRPIPTQLVSVAQVELIEDITVYNFIKPTSLSDSGKDIIAWAEHEELSNHFATPNYGEASYYLATQYISEYIKHMKVTDGQTTFDGLCFRSSLNPDGTNYVLFDVSPSRKYQICSSSLCQVKDLTGNFHIYTPYDCLA